MKYLLDTHIFLWMNDCPEKLSKNALNICQNPQNELYLSLVSVWEIQIKSQLKKLELSSALSQIVETQQKDNNINLLPIKATHIYMLDSLAFHHNDPFDRLLIAQASAENFYFISADSKLKVYFEKVIW